MKKSITVVGKPVDFAYVIKDIDIDKLTVEKYNVDCRSDMIDAWGMTPSGQVTFSEPGEKTLEIVLRDKISNVTLIGRASVIEIASKMGGKIIKDIKVERAKRGKKTYISDLIFFKEVVFEK